VARRLNSPIREQLTPEELEELRRKLAAMPQHELATLYRSTHNACRYEVKLPSPRMIQELVQVWKQLRKVSRWRSSNTLLLWLAALQNTRLNKRFHLRIRSTLRYKSTEAWLNDHANVCAMSVSE